MAEISPLFRSAVVTSDDRSEEPSSDSARPISPLVPLNDPLLARFIDSEGEERERQLEVLILVLARPAIERAMLPLRHGNFALTDEDAQDVAATVALRLVRRLRAAALDECEAIRHLDDYVAKMTLNTAHDSIRERFPQRARLKQHLRYLMTHDVRLALWPTPSGTAAGLASWRGELNVLARADLTFAASSREMCNRGAPADAVVAMLHRIGGPLSFDALASLAALLWGVKDAAAIVTEPSIKSESSPLARMESRQLLETLWEEIELLRPSQRAALLLNLRDANGDNAVAFLLLLGIASFDAIAGAIAITIEELAERWRSLPLDDLTIAGMLNMTRQQVINLRQAARKRLTRRIDARARSGRR